MRLDHIAYRVADRHKTAEFFCSALGYKIASPFQPKFDDGSVVNCLALEPPEKPDCGDEKMDNWLWFGYHDLWNEIGEGGDGGVKIASDVEYHLAPEVFVSDGNPESIVGQWVAERGGIGGIHHLAYQVESVSDTMREWRDKGWAEFATDDPLTCPDLVQCFTKPSVITGVIFEFIERGKHGFCSENVAALMNSTKGI
jgi:catechol 2,3-dioxygenase-like lactoylglutathione lyase family enzyme